MVPAKSSSKMKKPKNDINFYRDLWLKKYHNTNCEEVIRLHPEEATSGEWFKLYPCTEEQYEQWKKEAIKEIAKDTGLPSRIIKREWWILYLDTAPYVKPKME